MIECAGKFKIYFANHNVAPLVWCLQLLGASDEPTWEIAVSTIGLDGVRGLTVYAPKPTPDHEDGKPSAFLLAEGILSVDESGVALLRPVPSPPEASSER